MGFTGSKNKLSPSPHKKRGLGPFYKYPFPSTGGEKYLREKLEEATKDDQLLKKLVIGKPFSRSRKSSPSQKRGNSARSRSPHSPHARAPSSSGSGAQSKSRTGEGSGRGGGSGSGGSRSQGEGKSGSTTNSRTNTNNNNKRGGEKSRAKRGRNCKSPSYSTPENFEQAWSSSFFSPSLLLLITALGFVVKRIPFLHKIPIGGRLTLCSDAWKKVCKSTWVNNVICEGYKIPFKHVPLQSRVPSNPAASGAAFDVLVAEAEALNLMDAIAPVASCEGHYISSYFAIPKASLQANFDPS